MSWCSILFIQSALPNKNCVLIIEQELIIAKNFFSGAIPTEIGNLVKLRNIQIADNLFEGKVIHTSLFGNDWVVLLF